MRMGGLMEAARRSRFLTDLSPYDRDAWRIAAAVPLGALAGAVAGLIGATLATLASLLVVSGLDGAPAAGDLFAVFSAPGLAEPTARQSLFFLAVLAGVNLGAAIGFVLFLSAQTNGFGLAEAPPTDMATTLYRWASAAATSLLLAGVSAVIAVVMWAVAYRRID